MPYKGDAGRDQGCNTYITHTHIETGERSNDYTYNYGQLDWLTINCGMV